MHFITWSYSSRREKAFRRETIEVPSDPVAYSFQSSESFPDDI